jgi:hypothetical protein
MPLTEIERAIANPSYARSIRNSSEASPCRGSVVPGTSARQGTPFTEATSGRRLRDAGRPSTRGKRRTGSPRSDIPRRRLRRSGEGPDLATYQCLRGWSVTNLPCDGDASSRRRFEIQCCGLGPPGDTLRMPVWKQRPALPAFGSRCRRSVTAPGNEPSRVTDVTAPAPQPLRQSIFDTSGAARAGYRGTRPRSRPLGCH